MGGFFPPRACNEYSQYSTLRPTGVTASAALLRGGQRLPRQGAQRDSLHPPDFLVGQAVLQPQAVVGNLNEVARRHCRKVVGVGIDQCNVVRVRSSEVRDAAKGLIAQPAAL